MFKAEPAFIALPSSFAHRVNNDPDHVTIDGRVDYDATIGRLGGVMQLHLDGSDDDTNVEVVVRTEFLVIVPWMQLWATPAPTSPDPQVQVTLAVTADECWFRGATQEEFGVSDYQISPSSVFYLRFPESLDAAHLSYFDSAVAADKEDSEGWGFVDLFMDLDTTIDQILAVPGSTHTYSGRQGLPRNGQPRLPVVVGLENKLRVFSNDISYDVGFASTWTLNRVEFVGS